MTETAAAHRTQVSLPAGLRGSAGHLQFSQQTEEPCLAFTSDFFFFKQEGKLIGIHVAWVIFDSMGSLEGDQKVSPRSKGKGGRVFISCGGWTYFQIWKYVQFQVLNYTFPKG